MTEDPSAGNIRDAAAHAGVTIVRHGRTGALRILLGTAYGLAMKTTTGFLGEKSDHRETHLIAVCDRDGRIGWWHTDDTIVDSVNGLDPSAVLE